MQEGPMVSHSHGWTPYGGQVATMEIMGELHAEAEENGGPAEKGWRLLVLEDTGELLAADAKEQTGQGLSRLLNLVDGIVGQGLRLLVLVTTNEPLRRLHPAVARPGRAAATVEFGPFEPEESAEWLVAHGARRECRLATLAELFALAAGREVAPGRKVGF
jgi:hypothetical protein